MLIIQGTQICIGSKSYSVSYINLRISNFAVDYPSYHNFSKLYYTSILRISYVTLRHQQSRTYNKIIIWNKMVKLFLQLTE